MQGAALCFGTPGERFDSSAFVGIVANVAAWSSLATSLYTQAHIHISGQSLRPQRACGIGCCGAASQVIRAIVARAVSRVDAFLLAVGLPAVLQQKSLGISSSSSCSSSNIAVLVDVYNG